MAKVNFIRKHTKAEVNDEPIVDGNFIVTGEGNVFIDYGTERIEIISSGGSITGDTLPIGSITAYGKETAPANWLICDGSAVSRSAYADLFAVIGTKYGEGDGSTTFNLPNLKGRVPVGLDSDDTDFNTIGKTGGEKNVVLTIDTMPSHGHIIPYSPNASGDALAIAKYIPQSDTLTNETNGRGYSNAGTAQTGSDQPHNNLQPYEVNNFIIKAFQSAGVVAEVVNEQTKSDTNTYSCNYINQITSKSAIIVALTENKTITHSNAWDSYSIVFDKVIEKVGDAFSLNSDGTISYNKNGTIKATLFLTIVSTSSKVYPELRLGGKTSPYQTSANSGDVSISYIGTGNIVGSFRPSGTGSTVLRGSAMYTSLMVEEI